MPTLKYKRRGRRDPERIHDPFLISVWKIGIKLKLRSSQVTVCIVLDFPKVRSDGIVVSVPASGKMTMVQVLKLAQAGES